MPTPAKDPLLGRTIAQRYRLIARLGAGSTAGVYLARHVLIDRLGAIKIADPERVHDPVFRERFLREARAVNRINHPNIVEITDYGEADGLLYLVMEYVPGESLAQLLARGPLGWRRAAEIGAQIASALGRAHEMGVVHRALEPASVLVVGRREGVLAKLTDFGLAKLVDAAPLTVRLPSGAVAAYVAPEQLVDSEVDAAADLFALGAILFEATAGALPSPGARLAALAPETPAFFDEVVATLLAPAPHDRPRDGFEAESLLRRALAERVSFVAVPSPEAAPPPPVPEGEPATPPSGVHGAPLDRLADLCDAALGELEAGFDGGEPGAVPGAEGALAEARKLCATVRALSDLVASDTAALERVQARGRAALAELGARLDEVAREHSRALGWAGTIAERSVQVGERRLSGAHPVHAVEAMVWEQAALEQEEDRARERAARLAAEMRAYRAEVDRHNERTERQVLVVDACLEGRIAALRSLSVEAWAAVDRVAALTGRPRA